MGQKIHPGGLRVGVIHDWKSNWYTGTKDFPAYLLEDIKIREHIYGKLEHAGLSDILIRKDAQRITIDIYTARPGIVIGKSGVEVDALRKEIHGMVEGVTSGFQKRLEIQGVGYRAALRGVDLELNVGYSHPVVLKAPQGITFEVPTQTEVLVKGIDKQAVGQTAAEIRKVRPPEPYKGKGIRYEGEYVRRKVGKRA